MYISCTVSIVIVIAYTYNFLYEVEPGIPKILTSQSKVNVEVNVTIEEETKSQRGVDVWLYTAFDTGVRFG
jgi:hypothetical protein